MMIDRIYHSTEMDGAVAYGKPGKRTHCGYHLLLTRKCVTFMKSCRAPVTEELKIIDREKQLLRLLQQQMHVPVYVYIVKLNYRKL